MLKKLPLLIFFIAAAVYFATDIVHASGFTLFCMIVSMLLMLTGAGFTLKKMLYNRKDGSIQRAYIYDDPELRKKYPDGGYTAFSLEYNDGKRKAVRVRNGSEKYEKYMALVQEKIHDNR